MDLFNEIYEATYQDVLKYVVLHCKDIEDVEDIIQNVYFSLFQRIQKGKAQNINIPYVMGITKNKVNDYYRFKYQYALIHLFDQNEKSFDIPDDYDLEKEFELQMDIEEVWKFLKKKKVIIAKIFYLYFYLEETIKEIAIELNLSESNVKHYLYRTLNELKKEVKVNER